MPVYFIVSLLALAVVVVPIWMLVRIVSLGRENNAIAARLAELQVELQQLRARLARQALSPPAAPAVPAAGPSAPAVREPPPFIAAPATPPPAPPAPPTEPLRTTPPPFPSPVAPLAEPAPAAAHAVEIPPPVSTRPRIDWEQFTGAKLFAWIGGLTAFLAAVFFVKYSFENGWISKELRVALGFLFGLALIGGGLKTRGARYVTLAQTLIATGIVCLYAVTFACNSIYHFAFFGPVATFVLMTLITATAFLLAVRLEARVIAVLGMLGGFLTPILLSTGHDNPPGLFGYIALLDVGLIAVALHRRWLFLTALGTAGTVLMQAGWAAKFLRDHNTTTAMVVCLAFSALFVAACLAARRLDRGGPALLWSAIALPFVSFAFALLLIVELPHATRPGLWMTFVLLVDACLLALAWFEENVPRLHLAAGVAVFALLAAWTTGILTPALLPLGLAFYLLHAVLHTAFPLVLQRHRPEAAPTWWSQLFPPLALLLMLGPLVKLDELSLLYWPCVLIVDLLAIGLALLTASLVAVAVVLVLTLIATAVWIFHVPVTLAASTTALLVVGAFAVLFFAAGIFLGRRLGPRLREGPQGTSAIFGDARAQIPAFSALLPFLLLVMMTQRLQLASPSPVFGLALLLTILTLGLACIFTLEWLPACALAGVAALEYAWHARQFAAENAVVPLAWYVLFHAVFAVYPFVFRRRFSSITGPWAVAALSGVLPFPLVYVLVDRAWTSDFPGVLPVLFAIPPLASLALVARTRAGGDRAQLIRLAWFGGVALLFVTLVFPIQFERQWITLGWALEGMALLWLFHRVPHGGLRATGLALLVAAFVRLALNPAVLHYHARSTAPLFNWYLYSFGLVTVCLFAGARLIAPPRERVLGLSAPVLLNSLGTVLAFLLLNIEIADFFSAPGAAVLTFQFSGNFARDMAYTIGWAVFAVVLLLVAIWKNTRAGRYAALALLGAAVLKLFLHDLARLEALYRVGALFAVAVIAFVASFAYQRFLPGHEKPVPPKS
jgi:hypothetical protein